MANILLSVKICSVCKESKPLNSFCKRSYSKDGLMSACKICHSSRNKDYHRTHKKEIQAKDRKRYYANYEKSKARRIKYAQKHREKAKEYHRNYRKKYPDKARASKKKWLAKAKNRPQIKLRRNLRCRLYHALQGKLKLEHTFDLLGCSIDEFKLHLEKQFQEGMSWENYGPRGWHIDHIKPCCTFDLTELRQQKECFHYTNMRPLWAKDNLQRHAKEGFNVRNKPSSSG